MGVSVLPQPPRSGKGRSGGRGTYRRQTQGNYQRIVRSPQTPETNRGGGDAPAALAVAEPGRGPEVPPGLQNQQRDRRDEWRSGWTERTWSGWAGDAWSGWNEWSDGTGQQRWDPEWQGRRDDAASSWADWGSGAASSSQGTRNGYQ